MMLSFGALLVLAPLVFHFNPGSSGINLPFNYATWLAGALVIALGLFKALSCGHPRALPRSAALVLIVPALLMVLVIVNHTRDDALWLIKVLFLGGGGLFFYALFQLKLTARQINTLLSLMVLATLLQSLMGLLQMFQVRALHGWIPWSVSGQPYGIFQQPNVLASFLATGMLISVCLITAQQNLGQHPLKACLYYATLVLASLVLLATGSRIGLLAFVLGAVLLTLTPKRQLHIKPYRLTLIVLVIATGCLLASLWPQLSVSLEGLNAKFMRHESRLAVFDISWQLFLERPWWGHGSGHFSERFSDVRFDYALNNLYANLDVRRYTHAHNEPLMWMVEHGLAGLTPFMLLLLLIVSRWRCFATPAGYRSLIMLLPISLHSLLEYPFYTSSLHWFVWLFLLFLVFSDRVLSDHVFYDHVFSDHRRQTAAAHSARSD